VVYLEPLTTCAALLTLKNELLVWWYVLLSSPSKLPRSAAATSSQPQHTYVRTRKRPRNAATVDICEEDENDQQDEHIDQPVQAESPRANEEGSESGGGEAAGDADQFRLDEDLLL
jgi:hypothetical protein